jgi:hypothetical protein
MTTLSERNEIAAFVLEEVAELWADENSAFEISLRKRAQSLRQSPPPTAEGKVELWRYVGNRTFTTADDVRSEPVYERDTAAEAVIEAVRNLDGSTERVKVLLEALFHFDSSRGVNNG